jgi:ABC-type uncharacterized transport system substrate-binding protein
MPTNETKNENITGVSEIVHIQKMLFVFNALLSGWTVKMVGTDTFEFKKNRTNQEVNLDNYLRRFVIQNLSVDNISNSSNGNVSK